MLDIPQAFAHFNTYFRGQVAYQKRMLRQRREHALLNARAQLLLATEGIDLELLPHWPEEATLTLSHPKDLNRVRRALNCEMKVGDKRPVEKSPSRVWVYVNIAGYPGLKVKYKAKLPKGSKCRIVKRKQTFYSRSLVCEAVREG